jgi:hypothetical protein
MNSMTRPVRRLAALAVLGAIVAACGSANATPSASTGGGGNGGATPSASFGSDLGGAFGDLSGVNSYKFTMSLSGGPFSSLIPPLGGTGSSSGTSLSGTVVLKPARALDVTVDGVHVIEIGGKDYVDYDNSGSFIVSPMQGSGMVASYLPDQLWGSLFGVGGVNGYDLVGPEQKDGVATVHYRANDATLGTIGKLYGAGNWSADVWVAAGGGSPVSVLIENGTGSSAARFELDVTNVNDPANKVSAPADVPAS